MASPKAFREQVLLKADFDDCQPNSQNPSVAEELNEMLRLRQTVIESAKALKEKWIQKKSEAKLMLMKLQEFSSENLQYNAFLNEKVAEIEKEHLEMQHHRKQKDEMIAMIQQKKDELAKKKEIISANNKANKASLQELNKAANVFKERLGLEIRKIHGEQLQFIFRCINHKDPELAYTFTLRINEQGDYEVTSCDPPLECMPLLQQKVRETNNFSAFLANIRKAFLQL